MILTMIFSNYWLASLVCDLSRGILRLGTFAGDRSLGFFSCGSCRLGSFVWQLSLRSFRSGWYISLRNFSLGSFDWYVARDVSLVLFCFLRTCTWDLSFGSFRVGSFVRDLSLGHIRLGSFVWDLSLGIVRVGTFA